MKQAYYKLNYLLAVKLLTKLNSLFTQSFTGAVHSMLLSSENVTLIVQRICHPLSILTLKGLRQGWSSLGFHGIFGCEGFFTAMIGTASSSALVMPGITRSIFLTL